MRVAIILLVFGGTIVFPTDTLHQDDGGQSSEIDPTPAKIPVKPVKLPAEVSGSSQRFVFHSTTMKPIRHFFQELTSGSNPVSLPNRGPQNKVTVDKDVQKGKIEGLKLEPVNESIAIPTQIGPYGSVFITNQVTNASRLTLEITAEDKRILVKLVLG